MNENLNLMDILKDCPKGTKLYSVLHGEITLLQIKKDDMYPIVCYQNEYIRHFTAQGLSYHSTDNGECILFPSKDQRDWSKFKVKLEMVDGEFYYCSYGNDQIKNRFIFIYKEHMLYNTKCYAAINIHSSILFKDDLITNNPIELRKATEEEKKQLLNVIKIRNYEWDADKKVLIKITPKFNISSFQPFDKVLVRYNNSVWRCDFYNSYVESMEFPFKTVRGLYKQCIPYNEDTKHLVDKNEKPPKKYITWEE